VSGLSPGVIGNDRLRELSQSEIRRYGRQIIIPEVGLTGQKRLKAARVLIVGVGGLGSVASLYLAAAGVGTIGLVDYDVVEETNLQRQIIFTTDEVGRKKIEAARDRLSRLNPHVEVETYGEAISSSNALDIIQRYDVVIDATDNFPARYLLNDACVILGKPLVYGSIFRFDGQVSVFYAGKGPCYRCLYPEPPAPDLVPSCAEGGVLGVLPGIVGTIQANEALKLIMGIGEPLVGRLLLIDALTPSFRELRIERDKNCPVCGENPTVRELIDYEAFCGLRRGEGGAVEDFEISPEELKEKLERDEVQLIDVREPFEWEICHIEGARLIPLNQLPSRVHELDPAKPIVVYCHSGYRSAQAVRLLRELGFRRSYNLAGGIDAYAERVDPTMTRY